MNDKGSNNNELLYNNDDEFLGNNNDNKFFPPSKSLTSSPIRSTTIPESGLYLVGESESSKGSKASNNLSHFSSANKV